MKNITKFLENVLKLKVNQSKSAVDRPWKRKFVSRLPPTRFTLPYEKTFEKIM
jgi:hypothetical protein